MQGSKNTVKLMVFALAPDQCCSNAIKTNAFLMQGSKNTVKVMVSATLVVGQREHLLLVLLSQPNLLD